MSLSALMGDLASRIEEARDWEELKSILRDGFSSGSPITLSGPLVLNNRTNEAAIQIVNSGQQDHVGMSVKDSDGREATFGIGLGNKGVVSNHVILDRVYNIDQNVIQLKYQGEDVGSGYNKGSSQSGQWEANRFNLLYPRESRRCKSYALIFASALTLDYKLGGYQYTTLTDNLTATIDSTKMVTGETIWWEVIDTPGSTVITFAVSGGGTLVWDGGLQPAVLAATKGRVFSFTKNSAGNMIGGVAYNSYAAA